MSSRGGASPEEREAAVLRRLEADLAADPRSARRLARDLALLGGTAGGCRPPTRCQLVCSAALLAAVAVLLVPALTVGGPGLLALAGALFGAAAVPFFCPPRWARAPRRSPRRPGAPGPGRSAARPG